MLERFLVGLFIGAFFAALPLWALSKQAGWIRFRCGGSPWRCTVTRWRLFSNQVSTFTPDTIQLFPTEHSGYRGSTIPAWELVFYEGERPITVLREDHKAVRLKELGRALQAAQAAGASLEQELPPDDAFWFFLVLTVLFWCAGMGIALSTP